MSIIFYLFLMNITAYVTEDFGIYTDLNNTLLDLRLGYCIYKILKYIF